VQSGFDGFFPARIQRYYWKSLNLHEISDELVDAVIAHAAQRPSSQTLIVLRHLGGAMGRIPAENTAFGDRSARFNLSLDSTWINAVDDERNIQWTRTAWDDLNAYSDGTVYLNFPGFQEEGEALMRRQFGKNYERLSAIKSKYDPTNFFHLNQNIKPG
jgi:FAD/FMN-containing dehydrogenase